MSDEEYTGGPVSGGPDAQAREDQESGAWLRRRWAGEDADYNRARAELFFARARQRHMSDRERAYLALAAWAATPEAQETAARARLIGLFDPVHPDAGPQCPSKRPTDPDRYVRTNPVPEALSGAHSAGDEQDGPTAVAPRPGRWRRWCRWWGG